MSTTCHNTFHLSWPSVNEPSGWHVFESGISTSFFSTWTFLFVFTLKIGSQVEKHKMVQMSPFFLSIVPPLLILSASFLCFSFSSSLNSLLHLQPFCWVFQCSSFLQEFCYSQVLCPLSPFFFLYWLFFFSCSFCVCLCFFFCFVFFFSPPFLSLCPSLSSDEPSRCPCQKAKEKADQEAQHWGKRPQEVLPRQLH